MTTSIILTIQSEASDLFIDESKSTYCPICKVTHEKSFSITRTRDGILYNCFRAKCGSKGFIPEVHAKSSFNQHNSRPRIDEYFGDLHPSPEVLQQLSVRYNIPKSLLVRYFAGIGECQNSKYFFFYVFDDESRHAGVVGKKINGNGPKSLLYIKEYVHGMGFSKDFRVGRVLQLNRCILLVEDMLSMIKASQYVNSAALLGTNLNRDKVAKLSALTDHLIIALDNDATSKSLYYKQRYGLFFDKLDILVLNKDIKDDFENEWLDNLRVVLDGKANT